MPDAKKWLEDFLAPRLEHLEGLIEGMHGEMRAEFRRLDEKVDSAAKRLDEKIDSTRRELVAEIHRLDGRIDGLGERISGLEKRIDTTLDLHERIAAVEAKVGGR